MTPRLKELYYKEIQPALKEKLGFKNVGPLVTDIGNGFVMDDYQMEKALSI